LTQPKTGVQRVALEMLRYLAEEDAVGRVDVLVPANGNIGEEYVLPENCNLVRCGRFSGKIWEQIELPWVSRKYHWLINFCNQSPVISANSVLYIHDAQVFLFPNTYSFAFRWWYRLSLPLMARSAKRVITVSRYSRDTLAYAGVTKSKSVDVIPNGNEHLTRKRGGTLAKDLPGVIRHPYALVVGSLVAHKNLKVLFDAAASGNWPLKLVVAGAVDKSVYAGDSPLSEISGVHFVGRVSDVQLLALYERATMFLSPSLFEGFGLPVLEACQFRIPVLCSDIPIYRELFESGVEFVDPHSPEAWSKAVKYAFSNTELMSQNAELAYADTRKYSWRSSSSRLLSILQEA